MDHYGDHWNDIIIKVEDELLRNPHSLKLWQKYIDHLKKTAGNPNLNVFYELALKELPGSYRLWYNYLIHRISQLKDRCINDPICEIANNAFERTLVFVHKMPRMWMDYFRLGVITQTRKIFDHALRTLPITHHQRIWALYIDFVKKHDVHDVHETALRVFRRYLKLIPEETEEYIDYLISIERLDEAAMKLAYIVNQDDFVSKHGKSKHQLWNELCDLISKNPTKIKSLNVDAIIRGGLRRYTDQAGPLWNALADYYVRSGLFERARDIYEEAVQTVTTVRDFSQVFDAYAQFEELSLKKRMEEAVENPTEDDDIDLELRLTRFENLMERRLLLLNSVSLRQNPHNVLDWHKRVELYEGQPHEIINTYAEAVQTVQPHLAVGKLHSLWVAFAKFYERNDQLSDARTVFEKAVLVPYLKVDDLASVWCEWAEMEIRHGCYKDSLKLLHRATVMPSRKVICHDEKETVQTRLYRSLKVWSLYADLEESFGTFETCKAVYDKAIDLKIATPQIIINYGLFLEENNYFEEALRAYEKGIELFEWPDVFDIWNIYLRKIVKPFDELHFEETRDLFMKCRGQCFEQCPPKYSKALCVLYAELEEQELVRYAVCFYERSVLPEEKFEIFNINVKLYAHIHGMPKVRKIYEKAVEVLNEKNTREICLRFADMETKMGEVDRARAIYAHCSQICDPRVTCSFWQIWKEFEVSHGNEDTMREMLRIKRSVQAIHNTQVNMISAQMINNSTGLINESMNAMKILDNKISDNPEVNKSIHSINFIRGATERSDKTGRVTSLGKINIDMDADDDRDNINNSNTEAGEIKEDVPIEKQIVLTHVFDDLKTDE